MHLSSGQMVQRRAAAGYPARMINVQPVTLEGHGIRLEPLTAGHHDALEAAAADGKLWELWFTSVPEPGGMQAYIAAALKGQQRRSHAAVGRARSRHRRHRRHDALPRHRRRDRSRRDRLHVVRAELSADATSTRRASCCCSRTRSTRSDCKVVGLRTDNFNFRSQRAIEALGAKKDGVLRHHAARRTAPSATR